MPLNKESFRIAFQDRFLATYGKDFSKGSPNQYYRTLASLVRDEISRRWHAAQGNFPQKNIKKAYYFSIEFLPGRFLLTNLEYLGIKELVEEALADLAINLDEIKDEEEDPGLGNGGLGRLASSLLDSLASLGLPGYGCGIRYQYGLFEQAVVQGEQTERPDNWLQNGYAWEYRKPEEAERVKFGGCVNIEVRQGRTFFLQENYETVRAVPYDIPIAGYRNNIINTMRLWSSETHDIDFEFHTFSKGDYGRAFHEKIRAESISQVLYPDDSSNEGKELRLKQQYFFVSAGLQSIIRQYKKENGKIKEFHNYTAVHINDTHPALAVAELMRILLDEEDMDWNEAWQITTRTISYTNHTLLPEALEKWGIDLFKRLLPRIYMIVEEINKRFCAELIDSSADLREKVRQMAVISDGSIKMANLAIVGSHSVNGVAKLHSDILKNRIMKDYNFFFPGKFNNKTNGISQRRWLLVANPRLSKLLSEIVGEGWIEQPSQMAKLASLDRDALVQEQIAQIKKDNKLRLVKYIYEKQGIKVDPESVFDIHIKRIHMYKRQLLNILHIMDLANRLHENPQLDIMPRTFIFAGKAAPAYYLAKRVIKLINCVAQTINRDTDIRGKIKVVFLENYNVSVAEQVFPAADVSEQISTASKEASGTGNMKLMMNGAVTLGTLDGANIEIREKVGEDNFFSFGLTAEEVLNYYANGGYNAWDIYAKDRRIKLVCDQLINGTFSSADFSAIYEHLLRYNDEFFVLHDFSSYAEAQTRLEQKFSEQRKWLKMCINNIAYSGAFSSDRTIREYAEDIWEIKPLEHKDRVLLPT